MTAPSPARAAADGPRRCPGCTRGIPATEPWCDDCWARVPFHIGRHVSAAFRRNEAAYLAAVHDVRQWLKANPAPATQRPPATLTEQMQDMADMLAGIGRHRDHTREVAGRCTVCSCGLRVQGRPT